MSERLPISQESSFDSRAFFASLIIAMALGVYVANNPVESPLPSSKEASTLKFPDSGVIFDRLIHFPNGR